MGYIDTLKILELQQISPGVVKQPPMIIGRIQNLSTFIELWSV